MAKNNMPTYKIHNTIFVSRVNGILIKILKYTTHFTNIVICINIKIPIINTLAAYIFEYLHSNAFKYTIHK